MNLYQYSNADIIEAERIRSLRTREGWDVRPILAEANKTVRSLCRLNKATFAKIQSERIARGCR